MTHAQQLREVEALEQKLREAKRPLLEAEARLSNDARSLARVGISASAGQMPRMGDMDAALNKAGITNTVERIKYKRIAERVAAGLDA